MISRAAKMQRARSTTSALEDCPPHEMSY